MIARYDLNAGTIQGDFLHHQLLSRRLGRFLGKSCHLHDGSIICVGCHEKFAATVQSLGTSYVPVLSSFDQLSRLSDGLKVAQTLEHSRLLII